MSETATSNAATVKVRLVKSPHGRLRKHRACIQGLGLRRIGSSRVLEDTPAVRGMIRKIDYLLEVEPSAGAANSAVDADELDQAGDEGQSVVRQEQIGEANP